MPSDLPQPPGLLPSPDLPQPPGRHLTFEDLPQPVETVRSAAPRPGLTGWPLAALLFLLTFATTTVIGALWSEHDGISADQALWASPAAVQRILGDPELLRRGLAYSIPVLLILFCHEMGHYLACRRYRLPATPPFFLPLPLGLGTLGAFIRIRAPIRLKRQLFDIGIAGPLAGFAALVPVLLYGLAHSEVRSLESFVGSGGPKLLLGYNLATAAGVWLFHGSLPPDVVLDLHPAALAAWVGLLATALNLLPLGQLDGGHILYAAAGPWQRRLALPLWLLLLAAGFLWPMWWIWCIFVLIIGLRHPPVRDEAEPLGRGRMLLALLALVIFVLSFMPAPIGIAEFAL